jgi:hypothetical protein
MSLTVDKFQWFLPIFAVFSISKAISQSAACEMIFSGCFLFSRMCWNPVLTANYVSVADIKQIM